MIYIVRHGQTDYNVEGRYGGRIGVELNIKGIGQSHIIHNELKNIKFDNEKLKELQKYI
ncbi:MAG: histidine phosphatase family protein [Bacilli bacterium]|nr:histidine phosphatase family protein [Bacilli bacterium]